MTAPFPDPPDVLDLLREKELLGEAVTLQMERVAMLSGKLGRMRARVVEARNLLLRHEHAMPPSSIERDALTILSKCLEVEL